MVGVDWIRCTGPTVLFDRARELLRRWFGPDDEPRPGRNFYACSRRWPCGVALLSGHNSADSICVDVPGGVLATLPADDRVRLLDELCTLGLRCTRLDIAIDYVDANVGLLSSVIKGCRDGELCRARTYTEVKQESSSSDAVTGWTVYLGKRGKNGSGRLVRVYDKGLETGTRPVGEWERWEVEFTGDCAALAARELCCSGIPWDAAARRVALGAVDFRIDNGYDELARRPRCDWWEFFLAGVEVLVVKAKRSAPDLERVVTWLRRAVAPVVEAMARRVGQATADVYAELVGQVEPRLSTLRSPVVDQFQRWRAGVV